MSSSSTRSPADRAQTTPIVALIALFAVCAGLSLYATTLAAVTPAESGNELAEPTLDRVYDAVSDGGVVSPVSLSRADGVGPDGYRVAVAVTADGARWTDGDRPPSAGEGVDAAGRPVAVSMGDGRAVQGRLRVWVWR